MNKAIIVIFTIITPFLVGVQLAPKIPLSIAWIAWGIITTILAAIYIIKR